MDGTAMFSISPANNSTLVQHFLHFLAMKLLVYLLIVSSFKASLKKFVNLKTMLTFVLHIPENSRELP